jgi:hypothetical protein
MARLWIQTSTRESVRKKKKGRFKMSTDSGTLVRGLITGKSIVL